MKYKRRNLVKLVPDEKKQQLQIKYAFIIVVSCFVLALLLIGLLIIDSMFIDRIVYYSKNNLNFGPLQWWLIIGFFLIVFGYIAAMSIFVINLSHRLVGPLYRIESIIKEAIETGKAPVIMLRKNDDLQETVDLLNQLFEGSGIKKPQDQPVKGS